MGGDTIRYEDLPIERKPISPPAWFTVSHEFYRISGKECVFGVGNAVIS